MSSYMATLLLLNTSRLKVLISHGEVRPHLLKGLVGDALDTQLLLALSEPEPKLSPSRMTGSLTEEA